MIHIIKDQEYEFLFLPQDFILYMKDGIIVSLLFSPDQHDNTTYFSVYKEENGTARKEPGFELLVKERLRRKSRNYQPCADGNS
jgi:hypothetical protein